MTDPNRCAIRGCVFVARHLPWHAGYYLCPDHRLEYDIDAPYLHPILTTR